MPERNAKGLASALTGATGVVGETVKTAGAAARQTTGAVPDVTGTGAVQGVGEQVQEVSEGAGDAVERVGGSGRPRSVREELRQIVREAALEVLVPVARSATRQAAMYAVKRGPTLARDAIASKLEEAGGPGALAKGTLSSVAGARTGMLEKLRMGAETPAPPWRERPLPMEVSIDVVVPLETAYELFTEFREYANLMTRGEIVDERPNERIEWERTDGSDDTAIVTFHRLSDRLTRVMVTYDHQPEGLLERANSLLRTLPRMLDADLMRFKAFAEMTEQGSEVEEEPHDEPRPRKPTRTRQGHEKPRATTAKGKGRR